MTTTVPTVSPASSTVRAISPTASAGSPVIAAVPAPAPPHASPGAITAGTPPGQDMLAAARLLLSGMGITPADLMATPVAVPLVADYIPVVLDGLTGRTRDTYATHYNHMLREWGHLRLDAITSTDVEDLVTWVRANARVNRAARGGNGTAETFLSAARRLFRCAEKAGLLRYGSSPAHAVDKPARHDPLRHALTSEQLTELFAAAPLGSNDPDLDLLILRLHTETGCRRGGALALRPHDLDRDQGLILLREKGNRERWQPVSPTLMSMLLAHATERCPEHMGQLLRYKSGKPITSRRYDGLWARLGEELPWVAAQQVTIHWLRHTTITWVERHFGHGVARAYAGHSSRTGGTTAIYTRASLAEIATALVALTGESHPLA